MIRLIHFALRKPVAVFVFVTAILLFGILAIRKSSVDIFPAINSPVIYVAQTYGGLSPQQMEGFVTSYYEYHFLYVNGIKSVDSKSIQGLALIKLQFHEGTDMAAAMAEVVSYATRARSFMPPGTLPPFITRYDAGSVPVGQLVFSSETRSLNEIQDMALFKVRPMFAALPGVSAPPPFGGNQRTVVVKADPERLRSYNITAEELVAAIARNNPILPAGNARIGDKTFITPSNGVVDNFKELENIVVRNVGQTSVFVRDIASVTNAADITTGYALINGKRSVYIPVTKRADASTWNVVQSIRTNLPDLQAAIPDDIKVSYEFDQSGYVSAALKNLLWESLIGAVLTGLMVLLFLRDVRSALIVIINIPLSLLTAVICLYLFGETINIMTLGGLALAVGVLVDESTVTIENIHHHLESGQTKAMAIFEACREIAVPKLLILLSVLAVFVPSVFMSGIPRSMFLPLSLAVGFAMIASFLLSQTLVPVLSNILLPERFRQRKDNLERMRNNLKDLVDKSLRFSRWLVPVCLVVFSALAYLGYRTMGKELFPPVDTGQLQVRLRMPPGTRIERTEDATKSLLGIIDSLAGTNMVAISSAFVGLQPQSYAINPIFLFTGGPQEAVIKVNLVRDRSISTERLKEQVRATIKNTIPGALISFEPADLVGQVTSLGADNPVEVVVQGKNLAQSRVLAEKLETRLKSISYLRDIQIAQALDYPTLQINYDRIRLGQMGSSVREAGRSALAATASSRLTEPVYWLDNASGNSYQVQVEYPQMTMNSPEQIEQLPVGKNGDKQLYLRDVAEWKKGNSIGEYDRINQQRYITVTANLFQKDLGAAASGVKRAIDSLGQLPAGVKVYLRGQSNLLQESGTDLGIGLALAIVIIGLLMTAWFQSFRLTLVILAVVPGVLTGSILMLWVTGQSINIQSFMGCIMAIGIAVSNAVLLISRAETIRKENNSSAISIAAGSRFRPIIMTSLAMIAGMIPMAIGLGEGGQQTGPLGIAVIGGLLFSSFISLLFLPMVYHLAVRSRQPVNQSYDPTDEGSRFFVKS